MKGQSFPRRLGFALRGLVLATQREKSFRVQLLSAFMVGMLLFLTKPPALWWALLSLAVGLVMTTELVNAALEALADHLHPARHPEVKALKDMAAAAVLVASTAALLAGLGFLAHLMGR